MTKTTGILIIAALLGVATASYSHSFSTSFLSLQQDNLVKYQLSLHDFSALNQSWLVGRSIKRDTFASNRKNINAFLQRTLTFKGQSSDCPVTLSQANTFATTTLAQQRYVVITLKTDCALRHLKHVSVKGLWEELPGHKVIIESTLPELNEQPVVLDINQQSHRYP